MPSNPDWIEHRRGDRERVGWMLPEADGFVVIDLLGRRRTEILDWFAAEQFLDELGIGYLADPFELLLEDGRWLRVRILEVSTDVIRVKRDDWGSIDVPLIEYVVPFPLPAELRPYTRA
jgi:hypothetical protein